MAGADELLKAGDLDGARAALVETLRKSPQDIQARMFFFQLLAIAGEWDKAQSQLRTLAQLSPEAQMLSAVYNQVIEAERARASAFEGRGAFNVLVASSAWVEDLARSLDAFARGQPQEGERLREQAFEAAIDTPGDLDGRPFQWIADADARLGPCFEAVVSGRWGLIPFEAVSVVTASGPRDLRDLIWLPIELTLRSGQSAAGFLMTRYWSSEREAAELKLCRATHWRDTPAGPQGLGQRVFALDGEEEVDALSLRRLQMRGAG